MLHRTTATGLAHSRVKSTLAAMLVTVATLLVANVDSANAASEIGRSAGAMVWCDAGANTIAVAPTVGAGDAYSGQSIRYRFWAVNLETGGKFWLGGSYWRQLYHQRVGEPYYDILGNYYPGQITPYEPNPPSESWVVSGPSVSGAYARFYVVAEYQWWSATYRTWIGDSIIRTTLYNNSNTALTFWSNTSTGYYCYL